MGTKDRRRQKTYYYPNDIVQRYLDNRIKNLATVNGLTESAVIIDCLENKLLPANENARFLVTSYLYGYDDDSHYNATKSTLCELFAFNAGGSRLHAWHDNLRDIISFCGAIIPATAHCNLNVASYFHHFLSSFDSVAGMVAYYADHCIEGAEHQEYESLGHLAHKYLDTAKEDISNLSCAYIIQLVLDAWLILGNYTYTFRALSDLMAMCDWCRDDDYTQNRLCDLITETSLEWDKPREALHGLSQIGADNDYFPGSICVSFEKNEHSNVTDVKANGVPVGSLMTLAIDSLGWIKPACDGDLRRFMFRHPETFLYVLDQIKNHTIDSGFKSLVVRPEVCGYSDYFSVKFLQDNGYQVVDETNGDYVYVK